MAIRLSLQQARLSLRTVRPAFGSVQPRHSGHGTQAAAAARKQLSGVPLMHTPSTSQSRSRSALSGGVVAMAAAQTLHDFQAKDIDGKTIDLSKYKGKVLLIVNVASECGFTPQYKGLGELHNKYNSKGFEVLAFPCNQFGGQEPGDSAQIKAFAKAKGAKFQLFDKVDVNGGNASPVWDYMKKAKGGILTSDIKWNFSKFLVDQNGQVVKRYGSTTAPEAIEADVVALLK